MGFFSDMLNPFSTDNPIANPGGAIIGNAMKGDWQGALTGGFMPSGSNASSASTPDSSSPTVNTSMSWQGDSSDPAYGSFTKPFDVNEFYKYQDPGYWWRLQQGQQAVQNGAASRDGALSGAALKDLMTYNQDMASTEYGNAFNRYQTTQGNIFSRLSSLAGLGQNAAAGVGNQGVQLAGQAGQAIQNAGSAAGAGIVGAGNSLANGASNYGAYNFVNRPYMGGNPTGTVKGYGSGTDVPVGGV